jgi:hypothetical protein
VQNSISEKFFGWSYFSFGKKKSKTAGRFQRSGLCNTPEIVLTPHMLEKFFGRV